MLEKIIKEIIQDMKRHMEEEDKDIEKIPVGKISEELRNEFVQMKKEKMLIQHDLRDKAQELDRKITRMKKELEFEVEAAMSKMQNFHEQIWKKAYEELELDPTAEYTMDATTGEVKQKVRIRG